MILLEKYIGAAAAAVGTSAYINTTCILWLQWWWCGNCGCVCVCVDFLFFFYSNQRQQQQKQQYNTSIIYYKNYTRSAAAKNGRKNKRRKKNRANVCDDVRWVRKYWNIPINNRTAEKLTQKKKKTNYNHTILPTIRFIQWFRDLWRMMM